MRPARGSRWAGRASMRSCSPIGNDTRITLEVRRTTPIVSGNDNILPPVHGELAMSMYIGESLVGGGNEVAHIDLMIGTKDGPVGTAFANALANQSKGHTSLLAVIAPNLICKPATVLITKVTIEGMKQVGQMFGPAQAAVGRAVADSVVAGVIPANQADNLVIVCGV